MSYARFGCEGSDVYVFVHVGGFLNCCGCSLVPGGFKAYTTREMLDHLHAHRAAGQQVNDETIADLQADQAENDAWIAATRGPQ